MELRLPAPTDRYNPEDQSQLRRAIEQFAQKPLTLYSEDSRQATLEGNVHIRSDGDSYGLVLLRAAARNYQIRSNDDGLGSQRDATASSWALAFGEDSTDRWALFRCPPAGAYIALLEATADGGVSVLSGTVSEADGTNRVRIYGGSTARVQIYPSASGAPWQIDNLTGTLRFFRPGAVYLTVTSAGHTAPGTDGGQTLGDATHRWSNVYALALSDGNDALVDSTGTTVRIANGASWTQLQLIKSTKFISTVGFNNTNPIAKPTVTGSRGANAALASLLTALANYGLIVDSSS